MAQFPYSLIAPAFAAGGRFAFAAPAALATDLHATAAPRCPDQAATLRRLFARRGARLLPILVGEGANDALASWIAKLAQGFARQGERTLLVDAARLQVAAALGLRARFDLAHAASGDCAADSALLDAGTRMAVLPAGRALAPPLGVPWLLRQLAGLSEDRFDVVLLLLTPGACAALPGGDVLLPLLPAQPLAAQLATLQAADAAIAARSDAPAGCFRLLVLGLAPAAAATFASRLAQTWAMSGPMTLEFAGSAQVAPELVGVVRAAAGWSVAGAPLGAVE